MKYAVHLYYTELIQFRGTHDECARWIVALAPVLSNGHRIYRTWTGSDGKEFYDVGDIYYIAEDTGR